MWFKKIFLKFLIVLVKRSLSTSCLGFSYQPDVSKIKNFLDEEKN